MPRNPSSPKIRPAIVGCGRIADMHAPGYLTSERARIAAICDVSPEVLKRRAAEWGVERCYTRYEELLSDPDIDLVEILTPHHLHRDMALQAFAAGKHVSLQKPMAPTLPECLEMIEAASRAGVRFKVFENFVFFPPYRKAKELMEGGEIGDPLSIRIRLTTGTGGWHVPLKTWMWRLSETDTGGGPMVFDDGYHKFSTAMYFLGPVERVFAYIDRSFGLIDSPAMITWRHIGTGAQGVMDMLFAPNVACPSNYYSADERVEITGTKGVIFVTRCTGKLLEEPPLLLCKNGKTTAFEDLRSDWLDSFKDSTAHFVKVLLDGGEPSLSGEEGYRVQQFSLAAIHSAKMGAEVEVPDFMGAGQ